LHLVGILFPHNNDDAQSKSLQTLSLLSSLNVSDHVSHPYKTTGQIIVLYTLNLYIYG